MADILVTSPYRPFTLPNQFKAVFNGFIYCGTVDAVDPSNSQIQIYKVNEDGSKVPVAQPLRTNAGGYLVYNGQPAKFVTDSNHSLLVRDSLGAQVWYAPDVSILDPEAMYQTIINMFSQSGGASNVGYNRGTENCVDMTAESKFKTVRHCADWGIKCDGTDETAKLLLMASDINAIPNPNGYPVKVVFSGGFDTSTAVLSFGTTVKFTRPVYLDGCRETMIDYFGSGNAFDLGPANLTGDSVSPTGFVVHKYYVVDGFIAIGGTTSGNCFYFNNYIIYPKVLNCIFKHFGGDGSWAIKFQANNWWAVVEGCSFDAHDITHADDGIKRNFVSCPGVALDGTRDEFATRLLAQNNQIFASGWTMGGIGYLLSGWKSRIVGGSIEGMKTDIIIGAGCNDIEIDGNYSEKNYPEEASSYIQLSYSGDPYFSVYPWVKRLKIRETYINLHNTDSNGTPSRFLVFANNVKVQNTHIDGATLVASAHEVLSLPEIPGHSGNIFNGVVLDGDLGAKSLMVDPSYATMYPAGYDMHEKNYAKFTDFSNLVSAVSGPAPVSGSFGTTGIAVSSDGSGGAYTFTNGASDNSISSGYERNLIGGQKFFGSFRCSSAPSGQTFLVAIFELNALKNELLNNDIVISFWAKANGSTVTVGGLHYMADSGTKTSSQNTQTISIGNWMRYAILIKVPSLPLGEGAGSVKQAVGIVLPKSSTFDFNIAGLAVNKGGVAIPFSCLS